MVLFLSDQFLQTEVQGKILEVIQNQSSFNFIILGQPVDPHTTWNKINKSQEQQALLFQDHFIRI